MKKNKAEIRKRNSNTNDFNDILKLSFFIYYKNYLSSIYIYIHNIKE